MSTEIKPIVINGAIENVAQSTKQYVWQHYKAHIFGGLFLAIVLIGFFLYADLAHILPMGLGFRLASYCFIGFFIYYLGLMRMVGAKMETIFMQQFADANNFSFTPGGPADRDTGSLFTCGRSQEWFNTVEGTYDGHDLRLFNFSYITGEGKHQQTHYYTICTIGADADVPRMYLDFHGDANDVPLAFMNNLTQLPLESNEFNKIFRLFITPGQQVRALEIFSPELMAMLVDMPAKFDLEIVGGKIYIYAYHIIQIREQLQAMFDTAEKLTANIAGEMESMKRAEQG